MTLEMGDAKKGIYLLVIIAASSVVVHVKCVLLIVNEHVVQSYLTPMQCVYLPQKTAGSAVDAFV